VALRLAGEGADVRCIIAGRMRRRQRLLRRLKSWEGALATRAELTSVEEIRALVQRVAREFGRIDVLVNSAANFLPSSVISRRKRFGMLRWIRM